MAGGHWALPRPLPQPCPALDMKQGLRALLTSSAQAVDSGRARNHAVPGLRGIGQG